MGPVADFARRGRVPSTTHLGIGRGQSYREIARGMRTSAATIARWRTRFEQDQLTGLEGGHQGSKPRPLSP